MLTLAGAAAQAGGDPAAEPAAMAARAAEHLFADAGPVDAEGRFPAAGIEGLRRAGLLLAPFPAALGGAGLLRAGSSPVLFDVLRRIGGGDLSVGRLYEGHVNAVALVLRYGTRSQGARLAEAVREGALSGVWNAEGEAGVTLQRAATGWRLQGRKILASGAGHVSHPLVTASHGGAVLMTMPVLGAGERADLSGWTAQGMRATATGTVTFDGIALAADAVVGGPDDYRRQPAFFGGAWRFCAVQLGAIERLVDLFRRHLLDSGRGDGPSQRARVAECAAAAGTAAFWIRQAATLVSTETPGADAVLAFVGLTRMVTERAGLDVIERVHRGVGLASYMRPHPIERVARDLATYLRQPAPDGAMMDAAATVLASAAPTADLWTGGP